MNIKKIIREVLENYNLFGGGITPLQLGFKLKKKLGFKELRKIGEGTSGVAFSIGDGKVLKITTDKTEYTEAMKLKGRKNNHIADVYGVYALTGEYKDIVIIISEHLKTNPVKIDKLEDSLYNIFNNLFKNKYGYLNELIFGYQLKSKSRALIEQIKKELFPHLEGEVKVYAEHFFNMIEELRNLNVTSADFGPMNLGYKKNGNLAYLDFGFGIEDESENFANTLII